MYNRSADNVDNSSVTFEDTCSIVYYAVLFLSFFGDFLYVIAFYWICFGSGLLKFDFVFA